MGRFWKILIMNVKGVFIWHKREYWYINYNYTSVNLEDMPPNKLISYRKFWRKYSPLGGC